MAATHSHGHSHIAQYSLLMSEAGEGNSLAQCCVVDVLGFQYFLPCIQRSIARRIKAAVADAD